MVDICRPTKRRGEYRSLFINTEVNNFVLVCTKQVGSPHQILSIFLGNEEKRPRAKSRKMPGGEQQARSRV